MKTISGLLKSQIPTYELHLPLSDKKISYRPFYVKEEKILLMALEDDKEHTMVTCIKNLLNSCVEDNIDVGELPIIDIEYLFINVRAKSVGEICKPQIECPHTGQVVNLNINLLDIKPPDRKTILDNKIKIKDSVGVTLSLPTLDLLIENDVENMNEGNADQIIKLMAGSIEEIWTDEEIYKTSDLPKEEVIEFIESMSPSEFNKLSEFFDSIPEITHTVKYSVLNKDTNKKEEHEFVLNGMIDFFA